MDDQGKRLVLALVISFAFLFVYQRYMVPPAPVPVDRAEQEIAPEVAPETPPATENQISSAPPTGDVPFELPAPIAAAQEKIIHVTTPLYEASLTNKGGVITSFKCINFKQDIKDSGSRVEMVRLIGDESLFPMAAEFTAAGGPLGFAQAMFEVQGKDLLLEAGQRGEISFRYRTAEGLEMVKTLVFSADTYNIESTVRLHNRSDQLLRGRAALYWAPGLEAPVGGEKSSMFSASRYGHSVDPVPFLVPELHMYPPRFQQVAESPDRPGVGCAVREPDDRVIRDHVQQRRAPAQQLHQLARMLRLVVDPRQQDVFIGQAAPGRLEVVVRRFQDPLQPDPLIDRY